MSAVADPRASALAGMTSGALASALSYPLDFVRTRQALSRALPPLSTIATLRGVLRNEGGAALFRGARPAIFSNAAAASVFFSIYTQTQEHVPTTSLNVQVSVAGTPYASRDLYARRVL
jgi:hypothetical protein